ncbi:gephyrin-like molybdotransferase Glp [Dechloromonas sp. TW-R-39-2]|uniref:molybdopterin molybdotransferase MoeA n=1 Tax=Dechloromonas sp. TW-R-39-2 TaxID=2654218 RepID=UPI00193DDD19|nr:gephyrin-like molybdotransferase Glp [Dechloromonas sp. TW-R-39-2]
MTDTTSCLSRDPANRALSAAEARERMVAEVTPIRGHEYLPVRAALGRVLAADIIAPHDVPAHDNSAMDGYAIRFDSLSAEGETRLAVVGTALAGNAFSGLVGKGQAVRIMTGAVLPAGADTVVVQEVTRTEPGAVFIPSGQRSGQNTRKAGEDLARGAVAMAAGKRIGPAELGLIASLGVAEVAVKRRLRVAFFSTGDELASIGKPLAPGEVYDSNRYTLHGLLTRLGADIIDMGVVPDRPEALEAALAEAALVADAIITTGGVSVGEADFVRDILDKLGQVSFWKLNIKPGRPMAFGKVGQAWLFGLPGNPVAVMVSYTQFALDALLRLSGVDPLPERPLLSVESAVAIKKQVGRREYLRGRVGAVDGRWQVKMVGNQGSGVLSSMSEANCFIVLAEECAGVAVGENVQVQLFEGAF